MIYVLNSIRFKIQIFQKPGYTDYNPILLNTFNNASTEQYQTNIIVIFCIE